MPFTFSHPAIVLPLTYLPRRWFSLTGLVIGSLTPDFEYFLRMRIKSNYSHTLEGLFGFDLPLGLFLAFLFHLKVRDSLFDNLPIFFQSRLAVFQSFDWSAHFKQNIFTVLLSILIGAASHLFWDSFTHEQGYFVQEIPLLTNKATLLTRQVPIFKILQHASSLVGGILILFTLYKLPRSRNEKRNIRLTYWAIFAAITLMILVVRLLCGLEAKQYGNLIATAISAAMISLMITPLLIERR